MNKPQPIPKLIPSIPLPFDEVMKDVLRVKPPEKKSSKRPKKHRAAKREPDTQASNP
jgi:hypothetical protein